MKPRPAFLQMVGRLTVVPAGLISAIDGTSWNRDPEHDDEPARRLGSYPMGGHDLPAHSDLAHANDRLAPPCLAAATFLSSLMLFNIGTVLCSFSWSVESLTFFRALQAIGGGPHGWCPWRSLPCFPPTAWHCGRAIQYVRAFGLIIGRFGGVLVELFDWRMIFYMTIPFGVLSAVLGWFFIPRTTQQRQWSIDPWGLLTMAGFLVPLFFGLFGGGMRAGTLPIFVHC